MDKEEVFSVMLYNYMQQTFADNVSQVQTLVLLNYYG
jgi:hypothetical protein